MLKNMEVTIRAANSSDSKAIAAILEEAVNKSIANTLTSVSKNLEICSADDRHSILVAENPDGEVVGYVGVHWLQYLMASDNRGYVSELFVRQSARGRGIGRKLLEVVKEQAIKRGCSRLMVVNVPNRITYPRRFFLKLGWEERAEVANFILPLGMKT